MKVCITGINGFIASHVARVFRQRGWDVVGTTSRAAGSSNGILHHRNGEPMPIEAVRGADVVIHCAHDFSPGAESRNITGVTDAVRAASEAGVPRQIFVSSLSARADATSEYGRAKFETEARVRAFPGIAIVRPGTVVGHGGVFGRLVHLVRRLPVVPLIDGGRRRMQLILADDLAECLFRLANNLPGPCEHNLYYATEPTLRDLVLGLEQALHLRRFHVYVPGRTLLGICRALEFAGLRAPITAENVRGFIVGAQDVPPPSESLLGAFRDRRLEEILSNLRDEPCA